MDNFVIAESMAALMDERDSLLKISVAVSREQAWLRQQYFVAAQKLSNEIEINLIKLIAVEDAIDKIMQAGKAGIYTQEGELV